MATEIYIGNLPDDITEIVFKNKLKIFGNISSALVRKFQHDGKPMIIAVGGYGQEIPVAQKNSEILDLDLGRWITGM